MKETKRSRAAISMGDVLFTKGERGVLGLLFGQPDRRFQSVELIRLVGSGTGATRRVVERLVDSGLVTAVLEGRQKYYQANADSPIFGELVALVRKTIGLAGPLTEALTPLHDRIRAAWVYGSVAAGRDGAGSDIDIMVVSDDLDYATLFETLQPAEARLGRPIDANLVTPSEWSRRMKRSGFAARMAEEPRLFLIGSEDVIA